MSVDYVTHTKVLCNYNLLNFHILLHENPTHPCEYILHYLIKDQLRKSIYYLFLPIKWYQTVNTQ